MKKVRKVNVRVAKRAKKEKAQSKGNVVKAKVGIWDFWMLSFKRREEGRGTRREMEIFRF